MLLYTITYLIDKVFIICLNFSAISDNLLIMIGRNSRIFLLIYRVFIVKTNLVGIQNLNRIYCMIFKVRCVTIQIQFPIILCMYYRSLSDFLSNEFSVTIIDSASLTLIERSTRLPRAKTDSLVADNCAITSSYIPL